MDGGWLSTRPQRYCDPESLVFCLVLSRFVDELWTYALSLVIDLSGKKSKSVFDFLTYSRETGFSFSYEEVGHLHRANEPSNKIDRVSKFDNSISFGAKQNALRQIFF